MMRTPLAVSTLVLLSACGGATAGSSMTPGAGTTSSAPTAIIPSSSTGPHLRLRADGFGAFTLGMTKEQALATRLFQVVSRDEPICNVTHPLALRPPYADGAAVDFDDHGHAWAFEAYGTNVQTSQGIHVGSTRADVARAYPQATEPRALSGMAGRSALYVRAGNDYLGFALSPDPAHVAATSPVMLMEIRRGGEPDFNHDGC